MQAVVVMDAWGDRLGEQVGVVSLSDWGTDREDPRFFFVFFLWGARWGPGYGAFAGQLQGQWVGGWVVGTMGGGCNGCGLHAWPWHSSRRDWYRLLCGQREIQRKRDRGRERDGICQATSPHIGVIRTNR